MLYTGLSPSVYFFQCGFLIYQKNYLYLFQPSNTINTLKKNTCNNPIWSMISTAVAWCPTFSKIATLVCICWILSKTLKKSSFRMAVELSVVRKIFRSSPLNWNAFKYACAKFFSTINFFLSDSNFDISSIRFRELCLLARKFVDIDSQISLRSLKFEWRCSTPSRISVMEPRNCL